MLKNIIKWWLIWIERRKILKRIIMSFPKKQKSIERIGRLQVESIKIAGWINKDCNILIIYPLFFLIPRKFMWIKNSSISLNKIFLSYLNGRISAQECILKVWYSEPTRVVNDAISWLVIQQFTDYQFTRLKEFITLSYISDGINEFSPSLKQFNISLLRKKVKRHHKYHAPFKTIYNRMW